MKKDVKIILSPSWGLAKDLEPEATVEAEYGENVLEGSKATLAHHAEKYKDHPAPCNNKNVPVLEDGDTIVISHIDIDTLGGIMALTDSKANDPVFWKSAEFIDLNGPHHIQKVPKEAREKLNAFYAWEASQERGPRITENTDVTKEVETKINALNEIVAKENKTMIEEGKKWYKETTEKVESCLLFEDDYIRVFKVPEGERVFTNSSYYSPKDNKVKGAVVSYNENFGNITISAEKDQFNAKELMQDLFGPEAGGHAGIAGSPRNQVMTQEEFEKVQERVRESVKEKTLIIEKNKDKGKGLSL